MRTSFRVKTTKGRDRLETLASFERAWYAWFESVVVDLSEPREYEAR